MFNSEYYRIQAELPDEVDPAVHYAAMGWRTGIRPAPDFASEFLQPFYAASGWEEPAAAVWTMLSTLGGRLPKTPAEATRIADFVRKSPHFDAYYYSKRLPSHIDPALHYAVIGERMGFRPSQGFDLSYYSERYPDVLDYELGPLHHFDTWGRKELRRPVSVSEQVNWPHLSAAGKPTVVVVSHEASRTGAPILSWNIARHLSKSYQVISLLLHGGALVESFKQISAATIGPFNRYDWHPVEMRRIAKELVTRYQPLYLIANSVETHLIAPAIAALGVPVVALVHEFAAYTRPVERMSDIFDWAADIVFPATIVADSSFQAFPDLKRRPGVHVFPQGPSVLPPPVEATTADTEVAKKKGEAELLVEALEPKANPRSLVVLGLGMVQIRKGVDIFISTAAACKRMRPDVSFRFVWIGHGYDPVMDSAYSVYLSEQIARSGLEDCIIMHDAVEDLDVAYARADAFLLSSRLDPQPNVGIDAVLRGIPTVCFAGASGTAEVLVADPRTQHLVVPHLDAHAAAEVLCNLADLNEADRALLRSHVATVGQQAYDMPRYVDRIDSMGRARAAALPGSAVMELATANIVDPDFALPPHHKPISPLAAEWQVLQQWQIMKLTSDPAFNKEFRRPCAGFNPQTYAAAHKSVCVDAGTNPLLHWLRAGKPLGPWSRKVYAPTSDEAAHGGPAKLHAPKMALHAHLFYPEIANELRHRLERNQITCDLFVTTDAPGKLDHLHKAFAGYKGELHLEVTPNLGRDIGPFLTAILPRLADEYEVIGHVHGKRSVSTDSTMGDAWRTFLYENLIGGEFPMVELVSQAFAEDKNLGLLMAEDPHLVGWGNNLPIAAKLAAKMELTLAEYFDFPLGTMFWARTEALRPLLECDLDWDDYPAEPVAYDGSILHALERLIPFVVQKTGASIAGLRVEGTTW